MPVQPRMRGERAVERRYHAEKNGSAPHARGTRRRAPLSRRKKRFSPACAGNACSAPACRASRPVQPRMRGERPALRTLAEPGGGSAPHARGTLAAGGNVAVYGRFSPACAGNAAADRGKTGTRSVQPRMRGERPLRPLVNVVQVGSAPHARGTLLLCFGHARVLRFSPACAGNAPSSRPGSCRIAVQPRMRGERFGITKQSPSTTGSAPHARGTQRDSTSTGLVMRFSPACAGNAVAVALQPWPLPVQPRMRGERQTVKWLLAKRRGSAPHARGTRGGPDEG